MTKRLLATGQFVVCLLVCAWGGFAVAAPHGGARAVPVVVEAAQMRTLAPVSWVTGTVVSRDEARIAAEVAGRLQTVRDIGDLVAQGDVLARIDDALIRADKEEAVAEVAREKANITFLGQEVVRLQRLAKQNNAAQNQLDQTLSQRDAAQADLAAADARLRMMNERLIRTEIQAPFAGVVVARFKRQGEWVSSGDEVVYLVAPDKLEVEAFAPLALRPYLSTRMTVAVKSGDKVGTAEIRAVVPVADKESRLMQLRLRLVGGDWSVGEPVKVALPTDQARDVLSVSRDALVLRRGSASVFTIGDDGSASKHEVELGIAMGDFIEIKGDVSPGDKVVNRGNERLRPGQQVSTKDGVKQ